MSKAGLLPGWWPLLFGLCVATLTITGFGQMPLFQRYYLADLPGLGWLGAYYVTHTVHYIAAGIFLALVAYLVTAFLRTWHVRVRITAWGAARIAVVAVIVISGSVRVLKNRPDVFFGPEVVFLVDLVHLGGVMLWGLLALGAALVKRRPYTAPRG